MTNPALDECQSPQILVCFTAQGERLLVVDLVMKDSLTGYSEDPKAFPDLAISIRADMAKELLRCADEIDAGRHHPDITIFE